MRTMTVLAVGILCCTATPSRAQTPASETPSERGPVSAVGLVLIAAGVLSGSVAVSGAIGWGESQRLLSGFATPLPSNEAGSYALLTAQLQAFQTRLIVSGAIGAALIIGGVICVAVDRVPGRAVVGFAPTAEGGHLWARWRW